MPKTIDTPLTHGFCEAAKWVPNEKGEKNRYGDGKGLSFYVHPTGAKSWGVHYRFAGALFFMGLGDWPTVGLADARKRAAEVRAMAKAGQNPKDADLPVLNLSPFVADAFKAYMAETSPFLSYSTNHNKWSVYRNWLAPHWGKADKKGEVKDDKRRTMTSITTPEINRIIGACLATGKIGTAKALRKLCKTFFDWATNNGYYGLDADAGWRNPAVRQFVKVGSTSPDERVVGMTTNPQGEQVDHLIELLVMWEASTRLREDEDYGFGNWPKLILLTGQRPGEVRNMPLDEYDPATGKWRVGGKRKIKNGNPHTLPLAPLAQKIMDDQIAIARARGYHRTYEIRDPKTNLLTGKVTMPALFRSDTKGVKSKLDAMMAVVAKEYGVTIAKWRWHDLRRAMRTFAGQHTEAETAELLINHVPERLLRTYDRDDKKAAKGEALKSYETWLRPLVGENVVPIRAA